MTQLATQLLLGQKWVLQAAEEKVLQQQQQTQTQENLQSDTESVKKTMLWESVDTHLMVVANSWPQVKKVLWMHLNVLRVIATVISTAKRLMVEVEEK
jgi:murein endopeptidase